MCELSATLIHHLITVVPCCSLWIRSISFQLILATSPVWVLSFDLQHLLFPWIKKTRDSYHIISEILAHCQVYKFISFRDIISFQLDWKMLIISNSVFEWPVGWQMWEQKKKMVSCLFLHTVANKTKKMVLVQSAEISNLSSLICCQYFNPSVVCIA